MNKLLNQHPHRQTSSSSSTTAASTVSPTTSPSTTSALPTSTYSYKTTSQKHALPDRTRAGAMSPTSYDAPVEKPRYPAKRTHSPHIMDQALSVAPLRKPVKREPSKDGDVGPGGSGLRETETLAGDEEDEDGDENMGDNSTTNNAPTITTTTTTGQQQQPGGEKYTFDASSIRNSLRNSTFTDPLLSPSIRLEDYDWATLATQFESKMSAYKVMEEEIWEEWREWGELFKAWASTISVHDEERAGKRLRTRVEFVRGREEELEGRRVHYMKVVQAFESALALLGDG